MDSGVQVGGLYYDLDIGDDKLEGQLNSADKKVEAFGKNVEKHGEKIAEGLHKAAKGFAIVGAGLTLISKNATDFTMDLVKDARSLGREIGVTEVEASRLTAAFRRMGLEGEQTSAMFGIFSKNIVASTESSNANKIAVEKLRLQIDQTKREIKETTAEIKKHGDKSGDLTRDLKILNNVLAGQEEQLNKTADGFAKLGISTKNAQGQQKGFVPLLFEVADQFKKMPDGATKTALALELFGRSGKELIKVLNLGSTGIEQLQMNADKMGLTLNEQTITNVSNYIKAQKDLKESTDALKIAIGTATTPVLTSFQVELNNAITSLIGTDGWVKSTTVTFLAFGGPVLGGAAALFEFTANAIQAAPAIGKVAGALTSMTAISIAGWAALIVGDLFLIARAADSVGQALSAMDKANEAIDNANRSNAVALQRANEQYKAGKITKERYNQILVGSNAEGTDNWRGGLTWVHEKGPEIMDLPQGTRIIPHELSKEIVRETKNQEVHITIGDVIMNDRGDVDYFLKQLDRRAQLQNMGVST